MHQDDEDMTETEAAFRFLVARSSFWWCVRMGLPTEPWKRNAIVICGGRSIDIQDNCVTRS